MPRGRIVGLIGPNGAGKTTLFNVLSGLQRPTAAASNCSAATSRDVGAAGRAALGIGRTFQNIGLVKDLSVTDNLLLAQHTIAGYGASAALAYAGRVGAGERRAARARRRRRSRRSASRATPTRPSASFRSASSASSNSARYS